MHIYKSRRQIKLQHIHSFTFHINLSKITKLLLPWNILALFLNSTPITRIPLLAMAFYESIQNPSSFVIAATKTQAQNFDTLSSSTHWENAVSNWSTQQLFACRLICKARRAVLPILEEQIVAVQKKKWNRYINELIEGPRQDRITLVQMSEPEIVQVYESNGLLGTVGQHFLLC